MYYHCGIQFTCTYIIYIFPVIKEALTLKDTTIKPIIVPEPNLPYLMYEPHKIL